MIKTEQMIALVTFRELGTLSATAKKLDVSQPTLSRYMNELEEELGVKIFERKKNRLTLTKTGDAEARFAMDALKGIDNYYRRVKKAEVYYHEKKLRRSRTVRCDRKDPFGMFNY